ncbi:hypothetical protein [Leptolyngbya iicbica]|nr:hypothetical protein [Leptolyngbya sp. LK]
MSSPFALVTPGMSIAAYQIVYVDCGQSRLYGELVQHMAERQTCWLRPISLRQTSPTTETAEFLDVSNGPDIICADHVIQPVLDTDWLTVLATLSATKGDCDYRSANQHLRQFVTCLLSL